MISFVFIQFQSLAYSSACCIKSFYDEDYRYTLLSLLACFFFFSFFSSPLPLSPYPFHLLFLSLPPLLPSFLPPFLPSMWFGIPLPVTGYKYPSLQYTEEYTFLLYIFTVKSSSKVVMLLKPFGRRSFGKTYHSIV